MTEGGPTVPLEPGVGDMMSVEQTQAYWKAIADEQHLSERQRRNQATMQAPTWPTSLSEVQVELQRQAEEAHRRNAEDSRYNGEDSKARLASHGLNLDH
jgi:hypothetical protein